MAKQKKPPKRVPAKEGAKRAKVPRGKKTSTALARRGSGELAHLAEAELQHAASLAAQAQSEATRNAYDYDLAHWEGYAKSRGFRVFPISEPNMAQYLAYLDKEGYAVSTIRRRCSAISQWHRAGGKESPTEAVKIRTTLKGLARLRKTPPKKKRALSGSMVRKMLDGIDISVDPGMRDRVVLLTGLATGMRRSELAAMEWPDISEEPEGLLISIPFSKGDQEGEGQYVAIPYIEDGDICPASELLAWRERFGKKPKGPVFGCGARTINRLVKRHTENIGLDPDDFGAHSFRSGFSTEAARDGATLLDIMGQTRHKSAEVAQGYVQQAQLMENRATRGVLKRLQRGKK